ncbi:TonB-dependent receptor plug [Emticicia oligotrophica DSM 17448]|uniref:TonB-dependent receptor plug n=1 Tax=Emticicia oligotrophica (strain DSM 17448 / CIP 109782 / MTCC 6937 / GPTSA100-15) TaxID=929562 RepID=A0ABN4ABS1_EMTOG|nr:TonB-dependent receptor [Emticicia oligotrophica]AFK01572.1 TonB-dependent receptor plug [Emticicia oligotrophica DSM 17448]
MKKNLLSYCQWGKPLCARFITKLLFLLCFLGSQAFAADITITGKVSDAEKGEALPGVSITIKGTSRGATTDAKGDFSIKVPSKTSILVFSFLGYETQEIVVGNQTSIIVGMNSDAKSLEEVVVVGYGTQKKVNLTGAVSTIDSKVIENRPASNLANALQGTSPGLIITRSSGQPGSEGIGIQIRGASSANGSIEPLLIVDGVTMPSNTLQSLNPNDVESISVLKDAAAAAIYGAQAAGGVILVTTKKAKTGKVKFSYLAQQGTDWSINVPERMSLLEEAEFSNLSRKNSGSGPEYSDVDLQRIRDGVPYVVNPADTTTWLFYNQVPLTDQVLRKYSSMTTQNLSMSGGNEKLNFLLSGGYYGKSGVFKIGPDGYKRYNLRLNLGAQLSKIFSLDARLSYTKDQQDAASGNLNGQGLMYEIYRLRTRTPFFTPDGQYNGAGSAATVYARLESGGYNRYARDYYDGTVTLKAANIVKGLTLRAVVGTQYRIGDRANFARTVPLWGRGKILSYINQVNGYTLTDERTNNTNLQFLANYDKTFKEKHNLGLLVGYNYEDFRFENMVAGATNLVSNDLPTLNLGDDKTKTNSQSIATNASQSVFSRINYNYDGKYLIEATIRRDENSKLAPNLRVKLFPSASVGWNLHREGFMKDINFVSELKLRASWGRLGGALGGSTIGNYDYLSQLSRGSALVLGDSRASYLFQSSIPSQSLSWETIETTNVGFDLGLFKNKLNLNGDYYVKYNRNMLTPQNLPAVIGIGTPRKNNGELKSWGWELEARYRGQIGKDFSYTIAANLSDNQNKLLNFAGRNIVSAGTNSIVEGYPLNSVFGYLTDGYFQTADEVKAWAFQDNRTGSGDVKYLDLNGDAKINVGKGNTSDFGDLVFLGTTQPRMVFGTTLGFNYKGFDFSAFIQGVGKRSFRPETETIAPLLVTWKQALAIHRDYWTPENPNALYPRPYTGGTHNYRVSDKWLLNGQYARLKNLQVGYTIPEKLTNRIKISRARVFFSAQDILTFSKLGNFKGYFDPEQRDNIENDYPFFATASVGLNLNF